MATVQLSKGTLMVLDKLKKHPSYKDRSLPILIRTAEDLSDPDYIRCQFSYLLDSMNNIVTNESRHNTLDEDSLASAMSIPVKLILRKLRHSRPPLAHKLSQLFRCDYGPLHSTLEVGVVTIEWGNEGLVIPSMLPKLPGEFEAHVHNQSQWQDQTRNMTRALGAAETKRDYMEKFNVVFTSFSEKVQLIDRLVDVIISYNCEKTYNIFKCNCQHFTRDALSALGYKNTVQFTGKMNDYFEQLKRGKLTVPEEYSTHENLDDYVKKNLDKLTLPDMEYLLCQYFKYHLPSMEQMGDRDLDFWTCSIATCQSEELDSRVKDRSSFRSTWCTYEQFTNAEAFEEVEKVIESFPQEVS